MKAIDLKENFIKKFYFFKLLSLTIILSVFFVNVAFTQKVDTKATDILKKVSDKTKSYNGIKIDFSLNIFNKKNNTQTNKKGVLHVSKNKYNLSIDGQIILSDGKSVWSYNSDANEVQIYNAGEDEDISPDKILTIWENDFKQKYMKEELLNNVKCDVIELIPNKAKSYFKIRIYVNQAKLQVEKVLIFDKEGSITTYTINAFSPLTSINSNLFVFNKQNYPKAEIVDLRD